MYDGALVTASAEQSVCAVSSFTKSFAVLPWEGNQAQAPLSSSAIFCLASSVAFSGSRRKKPSCLTAILGDTRAREIHRPQRHFRGNIALGH